jgi:hypothetical protein
MGPIAIFRETPEIGGSSEYKDWTMGGNQRGPKSSQELYAFGSPGNG